MTIAGWFRQKLQPYDQANLTGPAAWSERCPTCGTPISEASTQEEDVSHNSETCRLVNLVLAELGVSFGHMIRVEIYPGRGHSEGSILRPTPIRFTSPRAQYSEYREYIVFHETKHLVDCLTRGQSEEVTPDRFSTIPMYEVWLPVPAR